MKKANKLLLVSTLTIGLIGCQPSGENSNAADKVTLEASKNGVVFDLKGLSPGVDKAKVLATLKSSECIPSSFILEQLKTAPGGYDSRLDSVYSELSDETCLVAGPGETFGNVPALYEVLLKSSKVQSIQVFYPKEADARILDGLYIKLIESSDGIALSSKPVDYQINFITKLEAGFSDSASNTLKKLDSPDKAGLILSSKEYSDRAKEFANKTALENSGQADM